MTFGQRLQKDFSTMTVVLIPVAIAINIIMGQIVSLLKLPIYLDSIGTVLVAIVAGPWAGALTGTLSNIVWGILLDPTTFPWFPVAAVIGFIAGVCANYGLFRSWWGVIIAGLLVSVGSVTMSVIINLALYGGLTPSGSSAITAYLLSQGWGVAPAVVTTNLLVEPLDKIPTCLLAWAIVKGLSLRYVSRFPRASNVSV